MVTFPTKTSSINGEKLQTYISFVSKLGKQCLCYLLFYKWWKLCFLISKRDETSHIKLPKYDSLFGTKISICLKKVGGMRLWIGTSSFNQICNCSTTYSLLLGLVISINFSILYNIQFTSVLIPSDRYPMAINTPTGAIYM